MNPEYEPVMDDPDLAVSFDWKVFGLALVGGVSVLGLGYGLWLAFRR